MMIYLRKLLVVPVLLAMCLISSCKDDPTSEVRPVLTLNLDPDSSEIVIPRTGGIFSVKYTLENPAEGASIDVDYAADWVEFDLSTPNAILFDAAENPGEQARSVEVTVTYPGMKESPRFVITQEGTSSHLQDADFEITVRQIDYVSAILDVVPSDPQMYYVIFYVDAEYADQYPEDESLFQADMEFFTMVSEMYEETVSETIWYYVYQGESLDYPMTSLYPSSEYVAYVYGINPDTAERLTEIRRERFSTLQVEKTDVKFDLDIRVNGPDAEIVVTPVDYDGYYNVDVFKTESFENLDLLDQEIFDSWMNMISWYQMYGYTPEEMLTALCIRGEQTIEKKLTADCEYIAIAYAIDDNVLISSPLTYEIFRTGEVPRSDNRITLTLDNVGSRKAQVSVKTTNDDPYALLIMDTERINSFSSDDEIAAYCIEYSAIRPRMGDLEETISHLQPESAYSLIAFGYYGKVKTTDGISRVDFTTAAARDSEITVDVAWDHHYDSQAVAALDERWSIYADDGKCLLPMTVNPVPAKSGSVYYKVYTAEALENPIYTDETITSELIYYGETDNFFVTVASYDTELVIAALAQDNNGDYGKLWKSEKFSLSESEVSDPQEFLDNLPDPESSSSNVQPRRERAEREAPASAGRNEDASGRRSLPEKRTAGPERLLRLSRR